MKAIKIDVEQKKVYEIEITGTLESMYEAIKCTCVTHIPIVPRREFMWLDDEGLLRKEPLGAFVFAGYPQVLSGNAIILGYQPGGNSLSTDLRVEDIEPKIKWVDVSELPEPSFQVHSFK